MRSDNHVMHDAHSVPTWVKLSPFVAMLIGLALAWLMYIRYPAAPAKLAAQQPALYRFLLNKWYFDEIYNFVFVRPALWIGRFDIFALSSDSEQFPISLVEAMAAARPVAAYGVGDIAASALRALPSAASNSGPVNALMYSAGARASGKTDCGCRPATEVGTKIPSNPSRAGRASGALMAPTEVKLPSWGRKTTGPEKATSPAASLTVTLGA